MSRFNQSIQPFTRAARALAKPFRRRLLEPVSALTHFAGAWAALAGASTLVFLSRHEPRKSLSLAVYGVSMVILYTASSLFHGLKLPPGRRMWLNRLDHQAIFLLIAGTYTPIVANLFPEPQRWWVLGAVWAAAFCGMLYKAFSRRIHGLLNASLYPALAWAGVVPTLLVSRIEPIAPPGGAALLLLGGLVYMAGFVIYARQRPDPWPAVFGHHEIWHMFVLGGSLCHFLFMLFYVVPA